MKKFISILLSLVFIAGLCFGVYFLMLATNNGQENIRLFYLTYEDRKIMRSNEEFDFSVGESYNFEIHYFFNEFVSEKSDYSITVVPNITPETDFAFLVEDKFVYFSEISDLSSAFTITLRDNGFTLSFDEDFGLSKVLSTCLEKDVFVEDRTNFNYFDRFFKCVVKCRNTTLTFNFSVSRLELSLDKTEIFF